MSGTPKPQPVERFRTKWLSVSVWKRTEEYEGRPVDRFSITLQKRYFDKKTQSCSDTHTFFPNDLPRLRVLLAKAFEYIELLGKSGEDQETESVNGEASAE